MKALIGYQDVLKVIKNFVTLILEGVTYEQRFTHKKEKMKDYNALFFIHQCCHTPKFAR